MTDYEPFVPLHNEPFREEARVIRIHDSTRSVNWIASSPLWVTFIAFALAGFGAASPLAGLLAVVAVPAAVVTVIVLAFRDSSELRRNGCVTAASPLWIFLTPLVYLTLRWRALRDYDGGGGMRVAVFAICAAIVGGFALFWVGLTAMLDLPSSASL